MPSSKTNQLRQKVEKLLQERGRVENFRKYAHKLERLIEELNVYQIEMDLQNEELRKSEENHHIEKEKYNDLFEFSPESLITLDKNLRITNSNLATVDLLELERSRLLSQPFSSFVHPDDQDDFYRLLKSLVEKKGDASLEVDLLNHHNLRVHVRISARHLNDLHYADRIMLVITDISQLKNTQLDLKRKNERIQKQNRRLDKQNHEFQAINEELRQTNEELEDLYVKLQKSEKRYRLLFEESTDPSLMLQGDQFVEANQAALDFLGYKDYEEIVGKKPWEVSPPKQADGEDSQKKAKAYIRDAIKKGYQRFEWLHTDKNNKERWIDVSLTYLPTAPDQSIYTIWRDITEAKRSEEIIQEKNEEIATQNEELQTQNEELAERNELILKTNEQLKIERNRAQHYLDVAGVMFVAINQEGIVTLANKKAAEILGYSEDEIVGKNWFDSFLLKDNISKIKDVFNDIMKGKLEQLEYVENFVVSRSGEIRMIAWHNSLLQGENGEITGTLSSGEDITEKHMAEKELKKIEWLLNPKSKKKEPHIPAYGDLRKLNTQRTILEAVGEKMLNEIVSDYLDLLETSAAVYEINGDYAVGIFSSEWCSFMDEASRNLCQGCNNKEALDSGKWHCHESCWKDASLQCMEKQKAVDIECAGGLNLYAIPILANKKVIGAINFGYGDPPKDDAELKKIAEKYQVSFERLKEKSEKYETRPAFIIDLAKERLATSAQLIGEIVERKNYEEALKESEKRFRNIIESTPMGTLTYELRDNDRLLFTGYNEAGNAMLETDCSRFVGKTIEEAFPGLIETKVPEIYREIARTGRSWFTDQIDYDHEGIKGAFEVYAFQTSPMIVAVMFLEITEKLEAQRQIKESEERFNLAMNAANDGLYDWNLETNEIYYSPRWKGMLGYAQDELENSFSVWETLTNPEDAKKSWEMLKEHLAGKRDRFEMEFKMKHKEGHWVDILSKAEAVFDENGKAIRVVGTHTDISERKKAERELKESEEKLRNIIEHSTNMFYSHTTDHKLTYVSPQVEDILGYTPKEIPEVWMDLATENPINEIGYGLTVKAIEKAEPQPTYQLELRHKNGKKVWVEVHEAPLVRNGKTIAIVGGLTDITKRKKATMALAESEELYKSLVLASPDSITFSNLRGEIEFVSPNMGKILKTNQEKIIGTHLNDWIDDRDQDFAKRNVSSIMKGEFLGINRYHMKTAKNNAFIGEVVSSAVKNYEGEIIGMVSILRDVTKDIEIRNELDKHRQHLEDLVKERTAEIEDKHKEVERMNKLFVGREIRIKELREKVKELEKKVQE